MHHIFVDKNAVDFDNKLISIDSNSDYDNYNHLVNSLRVKEGEFVLCSIIPFASSFDYKTKVIGINKNVVNLNIEEDTKANELDIEINLYQGLCKSDKFEFIIEKAVELGVHKIIPFDTNYTVVKFDLNDKKISSKLARFNKIAKSAAEQSKRHYIPEVLKPLSFDKIINIDLSNAHNILFYENAKGIDETRNYIRDIKNDKKNVNIFIGPEGGFSDREIEEAKSLGFKILTLGKRILRTETAAVTALSILMYELEKD